MRLSDAIALGCSVIEKTDPGSYCGCALAMALIAAGREPMKAEFGSGLWGKFANDNWEQAAWTEWPWILEEFDEPDWWENRLGVNTGEQIISSMFFDVHDKSMSLEQLIDWVRSVEPSEETSTEAQTEEVAVELARGGLCRQAQRG